MTMLRAVGLMVLSIVVLVGAIFAFINEHGEGFTWVTSNDIGGSGARTGPNAVQPAGGILSPGQIEATARPAILTATALAGTTGTVATRVPTRGPVSVEAVGIGETIEYAGSRYTVLQLIDPEPPGFFTATAGNRRITLEVRQEALSQAVAYSFALFYLRDTSGEEYVWAITNGEPAFGSGSLNPGESNTGWISFMIPQGAEPAGLVVLSGIERVVLVELR